MTYLSISGLPMIEESEATEEIVQLYEEGKRVLESPFVPNIAKAVAISPSVLKMLIGVYHVFFQNVTIPHSLLAMISYCIPMAKNCHYCAANGELTCRTIGIDEETLAMLAKDLGNVSPKRVQAVIQFALQCALDPQSLTAADYDRVRAEGVSDEELVEIIFVAAVANFSDTMADGLKIEVDKEIIEALAQG
jgi:uncharacterized peroxidase-related enzyme